MNQHLAYHHSQSCKCLVNGGPHRKLDGRKGKEEEKGFDLFANVKADIRLKRFSSGIKLGVDFLMVVGDLRQVLNLCLYTDISFLIREQLFERR